MQSLRIAMVGLKGIPLPSGVEIVVENLSAHLVDRGHSVTAFVRNHFSNSSESYRGIKLVRLPSVPTKNFDALSHTFLSTFRAIARSFDVIHFHTIGLSLFSIIPRLLGTPTLVQIHALDWKRKKWGPIARSLLKATQPSAIHFPTETTVVSKTLQSYFSKRHARNLPYIPNGVGSRPAKSGASLTRLGLSPRNYLLFAARLVPEKGCHLLIEAFRQIKDPAIKLVIAGDDPYQGAYAGKVRTQGGPNIFFTGFLEGREFEALMAHPYAFIQPSEIEGMSTGLLQSLAKGNCILCSDIPENIEVVGRSGLHFRSGSTADLRRKLTQLIRNPQLADRLKEKARKRSRDLWRWDRVARAYEEIYRKVVDRK